MGPKSFQLLIPDTINNRRAQWEVASIEYLSKIEMQLGLSDLKKGVDSLEIRVWYSFSFSNSKELYILKVQGSDHFISYHRFYLNEKRFDDRIVDSAVSKTVSITNSDFTKLALNQIWDLKSQSELGIPDSIGFTDCDTYTIEAADKNRFKFLEHHCPHGYLEKTKLKPIGDLVDYFNKIRLFAQKNNVVVPYRYD